MEKELWRPTIGVFAVIYNNHDCEEILLSKREDGRWNLPGGGMHPGEDIAEALKREVWEETGLEIRPIKLIEVSCGQVIDTIALFFSCAVTGGTLKKSNPDEVQDNVFLGIDEIRRLNVIKKQLEVVEDAEESLFGIVREKSGQRVV